MVMFTRGLALGLAMWGMCLILSALAQVTPSTSQSVRRPYTHYLANELAAAKAAPTHIAVEGYKTYERLEGDSDTHIRICDSPFVKGMDRQHCVVAECIPVLPCPFKAKVGQKVRVYGISRFDTEANHNWWEVHPVERMEAL